MRIQPYTRDLIPAVKDFNRRLASGGCPAEFLFPEQEYSAWLPKADFRNPYEELFAALDGDAVRGAYILKSQDFSFRGRILPIGYYHSPISEGIVNRAFSTLGLQLLMDALCRQPLLFALGMGGTDRPLPRLLKAMRWSMWPVPFYFKAVHPAAFLRNVQSLRTNWLRRLALDAAALSGCGWVGLKLLDRRRPQFRGLAVDVVEEFGAWADELWERSHALYTMAAVRNSENLNTLYPPNETKFLKLRVSNGGGIVGWAVLLNTRMDGDKHFGNLQLGSIVDCWAHPDDAVRVIDAAAKVLIDWNADLIISNQSHDAWCSALRAAGFREGPSNFIFAASTRLSELLEPFDRNRTQMHVNRGDGDGPIHL